MFLIPDIEWKTRLEQTSQFADFRLIADPGLAEDVRVRLSAFTLRADSANTLTLTLTLGDSPEAHQIKVEDHAVTISSASAIGIHHGLATLKLLLFKDEGSLCHGEIFNVPRFKNRGVFLDVSRGKVPTMDYLRDLISVLADLKYNILQLYFEDKFLLESDPRIGLLTGGYSEGQIRELDAWCRAHKIELQACIQTFSHAHGILNLPEYSHLAENENLFSLAAGKEEVYEFLDRILGQVLSWFSSSTVHLNMDEAYDVGTGFSKAAVQRDGVSKVFVAHLRRVVEIARSHGARTIIVWGDIALRHQEVLADIPDGVILADWNYNPLDEFHSLAAIRRYPGEFWAAGGISTWNTLFPRVYNSYINLINYSEQSLASGANGFLITDWGDYGHFQPLGLSLYGYLIGAQQSYHASHIANFEFEADTWPWIFRDQRTAEAFRLLMDSNLAPFIQTDFKSMSFYYFFDDLFNGLSLSGNDRYPKLLKGSFEILERNGRKARQLLEEVLAMEVHHRHPDKAWGNLFGRNFVEELHFSARATAFTGKKGLISSRIKEQFQDGSITAEQILEYIIQIKQLYTEFIHIRREFEAVWTLRADWNGIESTLLIFDKAGDQLGEAVRWLSNQYRSIRQGLEPDHLMDSYTSGKKYKILWTADFKDMWESAYPWQ